MSLEKAIASGKEHRKPYRRGKAIDPTCRNNQGCPAGTQNRMHNTIKKLMASEYDEKI